jgi:hypothetical protein
MRDLLLQQIFLHPIGKTDEPLLRAVDHPVCERHNAEIICRWIFSKSGREEQKSRLVDALECGKTLRHIDRLTFDPSFTLKTRYRWIMGLGLFNRGSGYLSNWTVPVFCAILM